MDFYEISIEQIPDIRFAYNVETNNYSNRFPKIPDLLEISLNLGGNITVLYDNGIKKLFEPDMVMISTKNSFGRTFAEKSTIQRHITFGVIVSHNERALSSDKLSFSDYSDLEKRVQQNKSILLPNFMPLGENARVVRDIISRATTYLYSPNPADRLKCLSVWFELCAFLTQFTLNRLHRFFSKDTPSDERYIQYALQYISDHISETIKIEDLAQWVGISQGYLQNLFKKITGYSIIQYINREKVELVRSYTLGKRMTLAEAAELVGIEDCSYMSRLFKKITGISFTQYQSVNDRIIK